MPTLTTDLSLTTYQDAVDRLTDYVGGNAVAGTVRAVKQSVLEAYDEVVNARNWRYLTKQYRVAFQEPQTGTCSYSSSTGQFTIDSGTWPTWAELALVKIGVVVSLIKTRDSDTVLTADDVIRPIADIASGTSFSIYNAVYPLPYDFKGLYRPLDEGENAWAEFTDLSAWLEMSRFGTDVGSPYIYSVSGHPYESGRYVLLTYPAGSSQRTYDFVYQRHPRRLRYNGLDTPCRSGTISSSGTTVTGSGSAFESDMVGAILRWGRDTTQWPDGTGGLNAFNQQIYIASVASTTSLTLAAAPSSAISSSTKYTISDPIDLPRGLHDVFWRCCEWKLSQRLKLPACQQAELDYLNALQKAKGTDQPSLAPRSPYGGPPRHWRLLGLRGVDDDS